MADLRADANVPDRCAVLHPPLPVRVEFALLPALNAATAPAAQLGHLSGPNGFTSPGHPLSRSCTRGCEARKRCGGRGTLPMGGLGCDFRWCGVTLGSQRQRASSQEAISNLGRSRHQVSRSRDNCLDHRTITACPQKKPCRPLQLHILASRSSHACSTPAICAAPNCAAQNQYKRR